MKNKEVLFQVPTHGTYVVSGKTWDSMGNERSFEYTVEAKDEQEAYEKVFGINTYPPKDPEPISNDPYLAFLRET